MENHTQSVTEAQGVSVASVLNVLNTTTTEVENHFPTIYSKGDVLAILNMFADNLLKEKVDLSANVNPNIDLNKLKELVRDAVESACDDVDLDDSVEIELDYNRRIDVSFNRGWFSEIVDAVTNSFNEYEEELAEKKEKEMAEEESDGHNL